MGVYCVVTRKSLGCDGVSASTKSRGYAIDVVKKKRGPIRMHNNSLLPFQFIYIHIYLYLILHNNFFFSFFFFWLFLLYLLSRVDWIPSWLYQGFLLMCIYLPIKGRKNGIKGTTRHPHVTDAPLDDLTLTHLFTIDEVVPTPIETFFFFSITVLTPSVNDFWINQTFKNENF